MTSAMTSGNPLKLILKFMLPLLGGNLLQSTYNIVDAAIVGRYLGKDALAAVGASSSVQFLVLGFCIGTCAGFAVPVAQKFGARDNSAMRSYVYHSMILTLAIAAVVTAVTALLCSPILHGMQTPGDIFHDAYDYLLIIFLGIPFSMLYNLLSSMLRAVGNSRTPFYFLLLSTVLNIVLDMVCIMVFHWGCAGAAIATIFSQAVSGILCLILIYRKYDILIATGDERRLKGTYFGTLLSMGIPMGLQFSITAIGSMVMQAANNGLGSLYISGFTAGMRIKQFAMCPFDALANAVSTFVSQNYGAGLYRRIRQGLYQGVVAGVLYGLAAGLVLVFTGRVLSMIFIDGSQGDVLDASALYLRRLGYFFWVLGILNVCRMSLQGLGFTGRTLFSGCAEMAARIFVSFAFVPHFGYDAITWADQTAWCCAALYVAPMIIHCLHVIRGRLEQNQPADGKNPAQ